MPRESLRRDLSNPAAAVEASSRHAPASKDAVVSLAVVASSEAVEVSPEVEVSRLVPASNLVAVAAGKLAVVVKVEAPGAGFARTVRSFCWGCNHGNRLVTFTADRT